ncbi:DUF397 domain-containing protein [Streptomyces canus]|uniref:DUF397 domain-containing protein n=1 Tax=Streptomyces canus TaxID=58343 RepID=A0AAW8FBY4_9ACTN|nr:DUF397 domain-containing protein [Streptomyces canus]MDQ0764302.1 hypothetical protein [Streptomyces canus]MDQ0907239.1 hypothetical protein [Streptomyces canus]
MSREDHMPTAFAEAVWRASSYSGGQGNRVEVTYGFAAALPVRDSKLPAGSALIFSHNA